MTIFSKYQYLFVAEITEVEAEEIDKLEEQVHIL